MNYSEACTVLGLDPAEEILPDNNNTSDNNDNGESSSSNKLLKKAFQTAARKHHPDKNLDDADGAHVAFQQVTTAYQFLLACVTRGQTGKYDQPSSRVTSDNYDQDHDGYGSDNDERYGFYDEDDEYDQYESGGRSSAEAGLFAAFEELFRRRQQQQQQQQQRGGGFSSHNYNQNRAYDEESEGDSSWDEVFEKMEEQNRRKRVAKQAAKQATKQRDQKHFAYMGERGRQAHAEKREVFEQWNVHQLTRECQHRGISIKTKGGGQPSILIEALIQDEARKRVREQLKQDQAPLLDEWAEVVLGSGGVMKGMKVRVIDFENGKYTVEWDTNAGKNKKSKKGHTRESKMAVVQQEQLRLWGTTSDSLTASAGAGAAKGLDLSSSTDTTDASTISASSSSVSSSSSPVKSTKGNKNSNGKGKKQQYKSSKSPKKVTPTSDNGASSKVANTTKDDTKAESPSPPVTTATEPITSAKESSEKVPSVPAATVNDDATESSMTTKTAGPINDGDATSVVSDTARSSRLIIKAFEAVVKQCSNEIRASLEELYNEDASLKSSDENLHLALESAIIRAKHTEYLLEKAMQGDDGVQHEVAATYETIATLRVTLEHPSIYDKKADLEAILLKSDNSFKSKVTAILKMGKGNAWITAVTKDVLADMEGDPTRLYQLLEGKKLVQLVDTATLSAATARKDVFSNKQVEGLRYRLEKVERRAVEDAKMVLKETEAMYKRATMQKRATMMDLDRGATVRIVNLPTRPDLEGKLVTYMGLGPKEHMLRLYEGAEIELNGDNFLEYDGTGEYNFVSKPSEKPTQVCQACTYIHEMMPSCSMCGTASVALCDQSTSAPKLECDSSKPSAEHEAPQGLELAIPTKSKREAQSSDSVTRPKIRCQKGKYCHFLKSAKCKYLHSIEEAEYAMTVKPSPNRHCRNGKKCRSLKAGKCSYLHSTEEVEYSLQPSPKPSDGGKQRTTDKDIKADDQSQSVTQYLRIPGQAIHWKHVKKIKKESNVDKITCRTNSKEDTQTIKVRGPSQSAVDKAVLLLEGLVEKYNQERQHKAATKEDDQSSPKTEVLDEALLKEDGHRSPKADHLDETPPKMDGHNSPKNEVLDQFRKEEEEQSQPKAEVSDEAPPKVEQRPPKESTPSELLCFLLLHATHLKCDPTDFLTWLNSEDINTMIDLADALQDELAVLQLLGNGLKKFKLPGFAKDVADMTAKSQLD